MKLFSLLLLLSVSFHYTTSAVGSYSYGHPLHISVLTSHSHHELHKRNDALNQLRVCQRIISDEQCNNGLVQESVDLLLQCSMGNLAQVVVDRCRQNSDNEYCNLASTYLGDVNSAFAECVDSGAPCTARCRSFLMMFRDEMGCCVNLEFNSTLSPVYSPSVFTSALWSSCNVDPIMEQCTPSTVELSQIQGGTCSTSSLIAQNGMIICNLDFLQPILDRLTGGCEPYAQAALEQCGVDESNQPCYLRTEVLATAFANAVSVCQATDTRSCDSRCTSTLRSLAELGGCCINNFFNGSLAGIITTRYSWFSYQYWSMCGIDSPGFCDTEFNNETDSSLPTDLATNGDTFTVTPSTAAAPSTVTPSITTTRSNGAAILAMSSVTFEILIVHAFWFVSHYI